MNGKYIYIYTTLIEMCYDLLVGLLELLGLMAGWLKQKPSVA